MEKINFEELEQLRIAANVYLLLVEQKKERTIKKYEFELPLMVELGEFLNHFPKEFKFWRFGDMDEIDKHAALLELADCINFMNFIKGGKEYSDNVVDDSYVKMLDTYRLSNLILDTSNNLEDRMTSLIFLGFKLGFTWNEIYEATLEKIKIINDRLDDGY